MLQFPKNLSELILKHLVKIYEENYQMLERFISSTLLRLSNKKKIEQIDIENMYKLFPSLELVYITDHSFVQTSPNIERDGVEKPEHIGVKRDYLLYNYKTSDEKVEISCVGDIVIKEPYISANSGNVCITVVQQVEEGYILFDFKLQRLLERFYLYEEHRGFEFSMKVFYATISVSLILVSLFLSGYGTYNFFTHGTPDLEGIFKLVVAFTLSLAIFDLGKTIFEQEVISSEVKSDTFKPKTLMNFTVSIIIALMIESLLIVFKISITEYQDLIYALYLIIGTSVLFISFSVFFYLYKKSTK
jgi:hypothetical protein